MDGSAWMQRGDQSRQVIRGGAWYRHPRHCRSAARSKITRDSYNINVGLRVVCASVKEK